MCSSVQHCHIDCLMLTITIIKIKSYTITRLSFNLPPQSSTHANTNLSLDYIVMYNNYIISGAWYKWNHSTYHFWGLVFVFWLHQATWHVGWFPRERILASAVKVSTLTTRHPGNAHFCQFSNRLFVFLLLLSFKRSLYIPDISPCVIFKYIPPSL